MTKLKYSYKCKNFVICIKIILRIILFPFVLIYLLVQAKNKKSQKKANENRVKFYQKSQLDSLEGREFELSLKLLFEKMGYSVSLTKTTGDFGADLIISKDNKNSIVQAKRYNHTVGVRAVQEVVSARGYYKIYNAIVVTNSFFSKEAEKLANECSVHLIDGKLLGELFSKYDVYIQKSENNFTTIKEGEKAEILTKYRSWI